MYIGRPLPAFLRYRQDHGQTDVGAIVKHNQIQSAPAPKSGTEAIGSGPNLENESVSIKPKLTETTAIENFFVF